MLVVIGVAAWSFVVLLALALGKAAARGDAGPAQRQAEPVSQPPLLQLELPQPPLAGHAKPPLAGHG